MSTISDNPRDWDLESLKTAIRNDDAAMVKKMLSISPVLVKLSSPRSSTALHEAASSGRAEIAGLLIRAGADVNARDKYKETPLYNTAVFGHLEAARVLIAHGALLDPFNYQHETPLYRALQQGHNDMAELLAEHGADINLGAMCQWTPLHRAAMDGNIDAAKYLIRRGARVDIFADDGRTALSMSSTREICEFLLACGADVNAHARGGEGTPLDMAIHYGRHDIVELLRAHGGMRYRDLHR